MKHHKAMKMYGPTTQHNIKTYHQMLQLSAIVPNWCAQPKSSLINRLINDRLLDASPTIIQTSPQLINISHRIWIDPLLLLPSICNLRTKVWNVMKSQVWRYNWSPASRDKAARWLCVHSALACCTFKTQAGSLSLNI